MSDHHTPSNTPQFFLKTPMPLSFLNQRGKRRLGEAEEERDTAPPSFSGEPRRSLGGSFFSYYLLLCAFQLLGVLSAAPFAALLV